MKKSSLIIGFLLILSVGIVGCGTKTTENSLSKIKSTGTIKIGTEGTYSPYTFHDKSGNLTGFDIDIAKEVSKRLGVKPQFVETKWDGMFAGLDAKRFDMVANEVGVIPARQKKYDFSTPYVVSKAVLIVKSSDTTIKKFADLKGKKSAQSLTSNLSTIAKKNGAIIIPINGFNQSIDLLLSKRVDATVNDSLSYFDLKKQRPNIALKVVDQQGNAQPSALMFNKGNKELVTAVNNALSDMKSDGTYSKISKKWFGTDVSK
ncbi:amino acid ABC transporter substrate-binding protein [Clostridium psychrophilum]|uniref:amino acid ABC transporter substrate-binding protein n=1 Tax=Clostridium psychrophilum TaxID=132926 RepID=UPI001C0C5FD7|nr:amino acid ABC transporter substrate-binding protein [Clostridium psychrophilum]MBU3181383.1 amino acid ABC transporter substrate-binding protein [Clostridium psychrophilum]